MADSQINHKEARDYWQSVNADVDGMLGGYPHISRVDLQGSKNFLAKLGIGGKSGRKVDRAVDCGAGIGRITSGLLLGIAASVDIVEPIAKFSAGLVGVSGVGEIFNVGLETWSPKAGHYALLWNQWCLGHLTDSQLVDYLRKCGKALDQEGYVIVKENMLKAPADEDSVFDELDNSVTRSDANFRRLFQQAGLVIKSTELQKGFPSELYPVRVYALQPSPSS